MQGVWKVVFKCIYDYIETNVEEEMHRRVVCQCKVRRHINVQSYRRSPTTSSHRVGPKYNQPQLTIYIGTIEFNKQHARVGRWLDSIYNTTSSRRLIYTTTAIFHLHLFLLWFFTVECSLVFHLVHCFTSCFRTFIYVNLSNTTNARRHINPARFLPSEIFAEGVKLRWNIAVCVGSNGFNIPLM